MECCNKPLTSLCAWDDAQLTDHAYNLDMCDSCGTIFKEDVWNDKGLRALLLNGTVITILTDAQWEQTNVLDGLTGEDKSIVLNLLRTFEIKGHADKQWLAIIIRRVCDSIFKQNDRDVLLKKFDMDELLVLITP